MSSTAEAVSETVINECCGDTTVTVNAYINSTSPTGRTLHLAIDSTGSHNTFSAAVMKPDGSWFEDDNFPDEAVLWFSINLHPDFLNDTHYFPIPEDWEQGGYRIVWTD